MRVEVKIEETVTEPYAVIYTGAVTDAVRRAVQQLSAARNVITAAQERKTVILKPEEIYLIRVEDEKVIIYGKSSHYVCARRLYELERELGSRFMRISKSAVINLDMLVSVEPSFYGMQLVLKNGCKDYVSRKYLPDLKAYLGI
jgi:two-component system response regulator LytT